MEEQNFTIKKEFSKEEIAAAESFGLKSPKEIWDILKDRYQNWDKWGEQGQQEAYQRFVIDWQPLQDEEIANAIKVISADRGLGTRDLAGLWSDYKVLSNIKPEQSIGENKETEERFRQFVRANAEITTLTLEQVEEEIFETRSHAELYLRGAGLEKTHVITGDFPKFRIVPIENKSKEGGQA